MRAVESNGLDATFQVNRFAPMRAVERAQV